MWQSVMEFYKDKFDWKPRKLDSQYRITVGGIEVGFKIWEQSNGKFVGVCQYQVQGPGCAGPYSSSRLESTPADALEDALKGFFNFLSPGAKLTDNWGDDDRVIIYKGDDDSDR